jgi:predicted RNase H-like HicB family nuclease
MPVFPVSGCARVAHRLALSEPITRACLKDCEPGEIRTHDLFHGGTERNGRLRKEMARHFKIVVEKHSDGYVAYPLGMKGTVVGEGDSYEEALADVKSAIRFHIETFGDEVLPNDSALIEAFIAEATISV